MTARGAVVVMFSVFFVGMLAAGWLHLGSLTGLSFVAGCALAARYTKREGLLTAVLTPPLLFMIALIVTETMTSHADTLRRTLTSAGEGIVLTLASVAPWLFGGVIISVIVALCSGLPRSFRELRSDVRGGRGSRPQPPVRPADGDFRAVSPPSARPVRPSGLAGHGRVPRSADPGGPAPRRRGG
jgi:hypothetical protein